LAFIVLFPYTHQQQADGGDNLGVAIAVDIEHGVATMLLTLARQEAERNVADYVPPPRTDTAIPAQR
jgi:hypothetical protein